MSIKLLRFVGIFFCGCFFSTQCIAKQLDLLVFGQPLMDKSYRVSEQQYQELSKHQNFNQPEKLKNFQSLGESIGGSALNTVLDFVWLGGKDIGFVGKIADDETGKQIAKVLLEKNIDFSTPRAKNEVETGECLVFVNEHGERLMFSNLGASTQLSVDDLNREQTTSAKIVLLEGYLMGSSSSQALVYAAAKLTHQANHQVAFTLSDPNFARAFQHTLKEFAFSEVDILFGNEEEYQALFPNFKKDQILNHLKSLQQRPSIIVMTRGAHGSTVLLADNRVFQFDAGSPKQLLDTTGAGDMYASAFLYGLLNEQNINRAGLLARENAAHIIAQHGGHMT